MTSMMTSCARRRLLVWLALLLLAGMHRAMAQTQAQTGVAQTQAERPLESTQGLPDPPAQSKPILTIFPHSDTSRYLLWGQANIVFQADGPFHSPYEGTNSFIGRGE